MKKFLDLKYKTDGNEYNFLDVYLPDKSDFTTVIYFHGGGLESGSRKLDDNRLTLVDNGFAVVSVEYSMLPKYHFPDFLFDAAYAVSFVQKNIEAWGGNGKFVIYGTSAGAYIAMMLNLNCEYYMAADVNPNSISAYISESAQQFAHFNLLKDRGFDGRIERIDETAPINYISGNKQMIPSLLIYYSDDMLCRPEENKLMYASIKRLMPEAKIEIAEITGTHCDPKHPSELNDLTISYMNKILG